MARKKYIKDKDGNPVEIDQDKIDAALAAAVTNRDGSHPIQNPIPQPADPPKDWNEKELELVNEPAPATNEEQENPIIPDEDVPLKDESPSHIAMSQQEFVKACYDMTIDAKQCFYQSSKNEDKSVVEYIRSINKRIYDETQKGGFSTNIMFRVTPNDWVNVNHIIDWYRSKGFVVIVKDTNSPQYGQAAGTIEHDFTISWATANA